MAYESKEALLFKIILSFLLPMLTYLISIYEQNEFFNMVILTSIPMFILIIHKYLLSGIGNLSALHIPAGLVVIIGLLLATKKSWQDALRNPNKNTKNRTISASIYGSIIFVTLLLMSFFAIMDKKSSLNVY